MADPTHAGGCPRGGTAPPAPRDGVPEAAASGRGSHGAAGHGTGPVGPVPPPRRIPAPQDVAVARPHPAEAGKRAAGSVAYAAPNRVLDSGSERTRWPVKAATALATAGGTPGTPGSPMPPMGAPLSTIRTCTRGIRSGGNTL